MAQDLRELRYGANASVHLTLTFLLTKVCILHLQCLFPTDIPYTIIVFLISRMDDLIAMVHRNSTCHVVQAST